MQSITWCWVGRLGESDSYFVKLHLEQLYSMICLFLINPWVYQIETSEKDSYLLNQYQKQILIGIK